MVTILSLIIILLIGIILLQFYNKKVRSRSLAYLHKKLQSILTTETSERLLIVTDDQELKSILIAINHLLDSNHKIKATYARTEDSMRKMLSNISHDLKTPLTVILGYIEILKIDTSLNDKEKEQLLNKLQMKANEVLALIHKFFDLAKLESGDKDIQLTKINVSEICRKNILSHFEHLTMNHFAVDINIPEKDLYALGNEEVLDRILSNLLSNAITYGVDGKMVGVSVKEHGAFISIDIIDKGKGIDEIHIDRVFERMYTLEDSRNRFYQGSGLGLTITKRLVEALGGEIHLKSRPYEKTVFTVMLRKISY
ncbi:sensor histidine kinase [Heyndrickxia oleronia]|uniref:sensor histidine kinase n=1 Tax=Heyndrickxia oleronia TaxID=38875 RepID=UPI001B2CF282|nr:sensor histidine kinase [Heyndrickxia oleronia]GIN41609.1 two-component sensor histidine kinase [Heyndrickxia oleronia]